MGRLKWRVSLKVKGIIRKRAGTGEKMELEPQVIEKSLTEWPCRLLLTGSV